MKKYMITDDHGTKKAVSAHSLEEALEIFKKLNIETASKEIRVLSNYELYKRYKDQIDLKE